MKSADGEGARRPYRMTARARQAEETADRILAAAVELFYERGELPLDDVAARAGVSTQTIIRRFGGREGLFAAGARREGERIGAQRDTAPTGDVDGAVRILLDHYEEMGDRVLALLAAEDRSPAARQVTDRGRAMHRAWCERVFAPALTGLTGAGRDRRLAQLVAVTDVFAWRLLRRDAGLPRSEVELALRELLRPLIGDH